MGNITAANAILKLTVASLYTSPVQIQGFATDDAFDFPDVEGLETMLGVDGILSAGWLPVTYPQDITLQADSASNLIFDNWHQTQRQLGSPLVASGTVIIPATGIQYNLTKGYLKRYKPVPGAKKVLQPRKYSIIWERLMASNYGGL